MIMTADIFEGDCLAVLKNLAPAVANLVYLDPPFFTQRVHSLSNRERTHRFSFKDLWRSQEEYAGFIHPRLLECRRILSDSGSLFFHCDRNAAHVLRFLLDDVFGADHFRAEIVWSYRRWSNAQRNLIPSHQTIYFYSKTDAYKFNRIEGPYSYTTNVDQLLQSRRRDEHGKSVYAVDQQGKPIVRPEKSGVPMGDVWEIPYLNPKAKERTGYPTQKPIALLERIISLTTGEGDLVVDPFCGSGTTLVAAKLHRRSFIGVDVSRDAVALTKSRLAKPVRSKSKVLDEGRESFNNLDPEVLQLLSGLDVVPVHRNRGIDALLRESFNGGPVPIRIQKKEETFMQAVESLYSAGKSKSALLMFLIRRSTDGELSLGDDTPKEIAVIDAPSIGIPNELRRRRRLLKRHASA